MDDRTQSALGAPDLALSGFQLWVHGYAFNGPAECWLRVTAHCGSDGASVWASGILLETTDIDHFRRKVVAVHATLAGEATLDAMESNIRLSVVVTDHAGHLTVRAELSPAPHMQGHWFEFRSDQSFLPAVITQCDTILRRFPIPESRSKRV